MANRSSSSLLILILKILMILIFAGWVSLWILKPTDLWSKKWKQAEHSSAKSVFSYNGLNFMVFSFPIIALAMIGFIYLELIITSRESRSFSALSNPIIITKLTGILSVAEVISVCLFLMFLAWTFYSRFSIDLHKNMPVKSLKLIRWQFLFFRAVIRCGLLAEVCLVLLFLPVLRSLAVFRIVGVQFEVSVRYHVWLGTAMILFSVVHGGGTLFIWAINHILQDQMWRWQRTGRIYLAGEIALVAGLVMWVTSLPWFRRKKFEVFYYTHHLYVVFMVFYLFHVGDRRFYGVLPGFLLYAIDKLLRIVQSRPETCLLSARIFPCKAIELILPKDPSLKYTPTSIVFINIPSISRFQWHCFSISSSSMVDEKTMSVIVKVGGHWTNTLYARIKAGLGSKTGSMGCVPVAIEGPYGPASLNLLRYESLLIVAGGSGITPFLGVLQEIIHSQNRGIKRTTLPAQTQLIYVTKNIQDVSLLQPVLILLARESSNHSRRLRVRVFVTQEHRVGLTARDLMNELSTTECVNFDVKHSGKFPIHGVESSVWMAVIVGCCSVVFLVLICLFNAAFMKGNDKSKIPSTITDVFLLCSFVAAVACGTTMAFLLRLRRMKKEHFRKFDKPIEEGKRLASSDEITGDALGEQCEISVGRPCFKDIFSEFAKDTRRSEIGVLVCGPEAMKESVASSLRKLDPSDSSQTKKPRFSFHSLTFTL
ncbi:ferric reduction oxidase 8, mitochondrial-like [Impatiens glandulifera]|uniref:ferric reduction oxidase 8, mitochondrial-like n=1 Tax=Impatiens glandulifera TaxID=253017 RepID=UPI001FB10C40|nr:ferric reduction oxidase 8, mitochondrial-like [Impatiens glandulifera]